MKIVDRITFLAMPAGTVFSKYEPVCFGELEIKCASTDKGDFWSTSIHDAVANQGASDLSQKLFDAEENGVSLEMDFDLQYRDGLWDDDQLFAVWEGNDIAALIARLGQCLSPAPAPQPPTP